MKHWIRAAAVFWLLLLLAGCRFSKDENIAEFYYLRTPDTYEYGEANAVIAPEHRDCSGKMNNLHYLLTLYMEGPLESIYQSPFPKGTGIVSLEFSGSSISIQLSEGFLSLSGMDRTLAAACLARTCFALHNTYQVHIYAQSRGNETVTFTLTREDLVLIDGIPPTTPLQ